MRACLTLVLVSFLLSGCLGKGMVQMGAATGANSHQKITYDSGGQAPIVGTFMGILNGGPIECPAGSIPLVEDRYLAGREYTDEERYSRGRWSVRNRLQAYEERECVRATQVAPVRSGYRGKWWRTNKGIRTR